MHYTTKRAIYIFSSYCLIIHSLTFAQPVNEAVEPKVQGPDAIHLIKGDTLDGWKAPSKRWSVANGTIVGDTGKEQLPNPEWLYTTQPFSDFTFTCELKLTGSHAPNSGIYFRVNPILFDRNKNRKPFEAASGYEFDVVPGKFCGSLGDWYARPSLRIFADQAIIKQAFKSNAWNRMTLRAQGNRMEYWINGIKIMDYQDNDPEGSRKGIIGLQIHDNAIMKVELRNAYITPIQPGK